MNSDIVLSRMLLERLVIVDDSITTYNAYKSKCFKGLTSILDNTIRISQFDKTMIQSDKGLLDCLEVLEQLNKSKSLDVTKDLQYIIDMKAKHKQ